MPGGWASALGAAISGGANSFQNQMLLSKELQQQGFQNQRQTSNDAIETALRNAQMASMGQQTQLSNESAARGRATDMINRDGPAAFDNPALIKESAAGKVPLQMRDIPQNPPTFEGDSVSGGDLPAAELHAQGLGTTGAVIPQTVQVAQKELERKDALATMQADMIRDYVSNNGQYSGVTRDANGVPVDTPANRGHGAMFNQLTGHTDPVAEAHGAPTEPPYYDPAQMREWQKGKFSGIAVPEPKESVAHQVYAEQQKLQMKADNLVPTDKARGEMESFAKVRALVPTIRAALMERVLDKSDPTGQKALATPGGMASLAVERLKTGAKAGAYAAGFPLEKPDGQIQQLAGLLKVMAAAPMMQGMRGQFAFENAAQHLLEGKNTAESNIQRLDEIESNYPELEKALGSVLHGQTPAQAVPGAAQPATASPATTGGPISVSTGSTIPYDEVVRRAQSLGMTADQVVSKLKASGVTTVR